jgi:hypothetical protein
MKEGTNVAQQTVDHLQQVTWQAERSSHVAGRTLMKRRLCRDGTGNLYRTPR